jgi:hypothetical protein
MTKTSNTVNNELEITYKKPWPILKYYPGASKEGMG